MSRSSALWPATGPIPGGCWTTSAREALARLAAGDSVAEVAAHLGVTVWSIYDLRAGRSYRHIDRDLARLVGELLREERAGAFDHLTPTPAAAP